MRSLSPPPPPSALVTNLKNPPLSSPPLLSLVSAKQSIEANLFELALDPLEELLFSLLRNLIAPTTADEF